VTKISQLSSIGDSLAIGDQFLIRDIDDATTPNKSVTVSGIARALPPGTALAPALAFAADKNTGIYSPGADQVAVATNGTGRLFIDSTGQVGIGTSSPLKKTEIRSAPTTADTDGLRVGDGTRYLEFAQTGATYNYMQVGGNQNLIYFSGSNLSLSTDGANAITLNTNSLERVRVTSAGLVGIGTSSPNTKVTIASNGFSGAETPHLQLLNTSAGVGTTSSLEFIAGGTGTDNTRKARIQALSGTGSSSNLTFWTTADGTTLSERLRINSLGLVGIGTTSPNESLTVAGNIAIQANGYISARNSTADIYLFAGGNQRGGQIDLVGGSASSDAGVIKFRTGTGGVDTAQAERARIDGSGRLLVGTSTAQGNSLIQIQGNANASNDTAELLLWRNNAPFGFIDGTSGCRINFGASPSSGVFGIGARIDMAGDATWGSGDYPGRLVFSTTADGASSPTERMRIGSSGTVIINGPGGGTFLNLTNSGGYSGLHEVDGTAYTIGQNSNVRAMRIGSGNNWLTTGVNLAAGGTSWGTYSDERLKTDIVELDNCLESIKDIRCVSYRLTDVDEPDSKKRLGVIAQDLVGKYDETVNASRRSEDDETEYLSVQYSDLVPVLLKALQEASVKIETLEQRLDDAGIY
jgi:hypothetical protein